MQLSTGAGTWKSRHDDDQHMPTLVLDILKLHIFMDSQNKSLNLDIKLYQYMDSIKTKVIIHLQVNILVPHDERKKIPI